MRSVDWLVGVQSIQKELTTADSHRVADCISQSPDQGMVQETLDKSTTIDSFDKHRFCHNEALNVSVGTTILHQQTLVSTAEGKLGNEPFS